MSWVTVSRRELESVSFFRFESKKGRQKFKKNLLTVSKQIERIYEVKFHSNHSRLMESKIKRKKNL